MLDPIKVCQSASTWERAQSNFGAFRSSEYTYIYIALFVLPRVGSRIKRKPDGQFHYIKKILWTVLSDWNGELTVAGIVESEDNLAEVPGVPNNRCPGIRLSLRPTFNGFAVNNHVISCNGKQKDGLEYQKYYIALRAWVFYMRFLYVRKNDDVAWETN